MQNPTEYKEWLHQAYEMFQADVRRQSLARLQNLTIAPHKCKNYREVYIDHEKWNKRFNEEINCEIRALEEPILAISNFR